MFLGRQVLAQGRIMKAVMGRFPTPRIWCVEGFTTAASALQQETTSWTIHHPMLGTAPASSHGGVMSRRWQSPTPTTTTAVNARTQDARSSSMTKLPTKKIAFQSLGCSRNLVDTEVMMGLTVATEQFQVTADPQEADYIVINTCGFLEAARTESHEAIQTMKSRRHAKLIVTGCMVNLQKDDILERHPHVHAVLGSGAIDQIVETIQRLEAKENKDKNKETLLASSSSSLPSSPQQQQRRTRKSFLEQGDTPRFLTTPPHYAYLKIAEGCKKTCSFCIIPKLKGRLQSKPQEQVVQEFQGLSERASEIILIAQDLGDYGKDFMAGRNHDDDKVDLTSLLQALLESSQDNPDLWLRLLYLYPDEITPSLLDLMQADARICRYLDMPIQHSHNDMLQRMRRTTSTQHLQTTLDTLRHRLPDLHIRTSLMVGFPGETDQHFDHLLQFVQDMQLDHVGCFQYSNEAQAAASKLSHHVPEHVKQDRHRRLMQAQYEIVQAKNRDKIGRQYHVVMDGLNDDGHVVGRYYGQCPDVDNQVIVQLPENDHNNKHPRPRSMLGARRRILGRRHRRTSKQQGRPEPQQHLVAGQRYWVEITGVKDYDLVGTLVHTQQQEEEQEKHDETVVVVSRHTALSSSRVEDELETTHASNDRLQHSHS